MRGFKSHPRLQPFQPHMQTTYAPHRLSTLLLPALLLSSVALAQQSAPQPHPAPDAHILRVRIRFSSGRCQGYCDSSTTVEQGWKRTISRSLSDRKHYPDMKSEWRISKEDWDDLLRFLDAKVLALFNGPIGCPGCADQPVQSAEVEYTDGTKLTVSFNQGEAPPEIAALFSKIQAISAEPPPKPKAK